MELLSFKIKIFELLGIEKTEEIGEKLLDVVLNSKTESTPLRKLRTTARIGFRHYGNITKRTGASKNKTSRRKAFASLFLLWSESAKAFTIAAAAAVL